MCICKSTSVSTGGGHSLPLNYLSNEKYAPKEGAQK